jgi:hypothetical protein
VNGRLCGPECWCPDTPHREPEPDWIGDWPIMHGESEHPVPGTRRRLTDYYTTGPDMYCLCGHPNHLTCPESTGEGSVLGMEIHRSSNEESP